MGKKNRKTSIEKKIEKHRKKNKDTRRWKKQLKSTHRDTQERQKGKQEDRQEGGDGLNGEEWPLLLGVTSVRTWWGQLGKTHRTASGDSAGTQPGARPHQSQGCHSEVWAGPRGRCQFYVLGSLDLWLYECHPRPLQTAGKAPSRGRRGNIHWLSIRMCLGSCMLCYVRYVFHGFCLTYEDTSKS